MLLEYETILGFETLSILVFPYLSIETLNEKPPIESCPWGVCVSLTIYVPVLLNVISPDSAFFVKSTDATFSVSAHPDL